MSNLFKFAPFPGSAWPPRGADARGRAISLFTLHAESKYWGCYFLIIYLHKPFSLPSLRVHVRVAVAAHIVLACKPRDRMVLKSAKCLVVSRRPQEIPSDIFMRFKSSYIALPFGVSRKAAMIVV